MRKAPLEDTRYYFLASWKLRMKEDVDNMLIKKIT